MIAVVGEPAAPVPRLLAQLAERGHRSGPAAGASESSEPVFVVGPGDHDPEVEAWMVAAPSRASAGRILVMSIVGAHPDAAAADLRRLWMLEERARSTGLPVLTLRLGPLVGPRSPLWLHLRSRPRLPRGGRHLVQPVFEADVVETLDRALSGGASWSGWFEVVGGEVLTLEELASLARAAGSPLPAGAGSWEPALAILECQRLGEADPWRRHFKIEPGTVSELARGWAA